MELLQYTVFSYVKIIVVLVAGTLAPWSNALAQIEICDNGIDDDGDSLIDLNDENCICKKLEPVSLIPNPSFEEMNCCPDDRSQLYCASDWIQASEATTDFIHDCGYPGWPEFPAPKPFPDGEGIMGFRDGRVRNNGAEPFWKEYAGACLLGPLLADTAYRFQFDVGFVSAQRSPPINISFFGTSDCNNLPFGIGNNAFGCPSNSSNWIKLGDVFVSGGSGNKWVNTFLEITPAVDIYAIAIGPDCSPVSTPVSLYYFFDNLLLSDFESFELQISETSHPCSDVFGLTLPNYPGLSYQWYKDGIALIEETSFQLIQMYGEGIYQVRIDDGSECRLPIAYEYKKPLFVNPKKITICNEDVFPFGDLFLSETGIYIDTFKSVNNCDSIVTLDLKVLGAKADTIELKVLKGASLELEQFTISEEGDHTLILKSEQGCDSLLLIHLSYFDIFFANIFSPNDDGLNDKFAPIFLKEEIINIDMFIYDRWGNLLYQGEEWDGTHDSVFVTSGIYLYVVKIDMKHNISKSFTGSVTVLR